MMHVTNMTLSCETHLLEIFQLSYMNLRQELNHAHLAYVLGEA